MTGYRPPALTNRSKVSRHPDDVAERLSFPMPLKRTSCKESRRRSHLSKESPRDCSKDGAAEQAPQPVQPRFDFYTLTQLHELMGLNHCLY